MTEAKIFNFKLKDCATPPPPVTTKSVVEIFDLTDDESDDDRFFQQPYRPLSHSLPTSCRNEGAAEDCQVDSNIPRTRKHDAVASATNGTGRGTVGGVLASEAWKPLMDRMKQNQKGAVEGNLPKKGFKRIRNVDSSSSAQAFPSSRISQSHSTSSEQPVLIDLSSPPSSLEPAAGEEPKKFFPIRSGFTKEASTNPSDTFSTCTFNHDFEDYSNILGWTESQSSIVEPNESKNMNESVNVSRKSCPFYKKIPGTRFAVDAFSYGMIPGVDVYFLSHFHSDHYVGLSKKFCKTLICDPGTGNLVTMKLGVSEECIRRLEVNQVYFIQGIKVVLVNANHCPGSVMFIFRLPDGSTNLHTGDFRFTPGMLLNPFLTALSVDCLYLDTTYCDPKYNFPTQWETICQVLSIVMQHLERRPQTLVVCGAYCIGKERVFFSLAEAMMTKVYCTPDKIKMLQAFENPKFDSYLSSCEVSSQIHVLPMRNLHVTFLTEYLADRKNVYTNLIAIKPTGWEFSNSAQGFSRRTFNNDTLTVIGIPYSEHSSFSELRDFVTAINPRKVQPTVGVGSEPKRNAMMTHISNWLSLKRNSSS